MGLRFKMVLSFITLITISVSALGFISYQMAADSLQATIEEQLREITGQTAEIMEQTLTNAENMLSIAHGAPALMKILSDREDELAREEGFSYLNNLQKEHNTIFENLVLVDATGKAVLDNINKVSDIDLKDRDYVQKALRGERTLSDVIFSALTGEPVIGIAMPIVSENNVLGALIGTVNFGTITQHAANIKIGENGYAYMIRRDGVFVYHPQKEKVLTENLGDTDNEELKSLVAIMLEGQGGEGFYTYEGVYKFVRFEPAANWVLCITANYDEYMAAANQIKLRTFLIVGAFLVLAVVVSIFIANNIVNPIKQLQVLMEKAGNGDLTVKSAIKTRDEIRDLGESFNKMISSQKEIVGQVRKAAMELSASSQEMAASSEQASSATQEISASIQQVAQDADKQNKAVLEVSKSLVQLSSLVQLAQDKAVKVNKNSEETMDTAQKGRQKVEDTVRAMETISVSSRETADVIRELNSLSVKVGEIITTINAIAEQTNLLALNAAIEAARAGEHGRGFAVVAEEVRKLAEESNEGATEIAALVNQMMKQTETAVESMDRGKKAVDNGVKVVQDTDLAFSAIITAVEETVHDIKEIVDITNEEVATSDQVVRLIDTVASITESTAASSQEVSAATEEQTAAVQTVASAAEEISALANSLDDLVKIFRIDKN
ncbi:MAG: methyl-accepting chemotaxis protein [Clostridia bacterium]|nr:methyl-accepting chemotaxis protein [Clostridia bacterium]